MVQTVNTFSLFDAKFYFAIGVEVRDCVDLFSVYGSKNFQVLIQSTNMPAPPELPKMVSG
jgi:hypothetical protein